MILTPVLAFAQFNDDKPKEAEEVAMIDIADVINDEVDIKFKEVDESVSLNSILMKYDDAFDKVVNGYDVRLQDIIDEASNEYKALPYEERIKTSIKAKLISKYISEIGDLDKSTDKVFYYLIDEIKVQLSNNGYDLIIANDYIDRYKNERENLHRKFLDNTIDMDSEESVNPD